MTKKITLQELDSDFGLEITDSLNFKGSGLDANNVYTVATYTRPDGTLCIKSTLSNPDTSGNYQTQTIEFYKADGATLKKTKTITLAYDANGNVSSRTVK